MDAPQVGAEALEAVLSHAVTGGAAVASLEAALAAAAAAERFALPAMVADMEAVAKARGRPRPAALRKCRGAQNLQYAFP